MDIAEFLHKNPTYSVYDLEIYKISPERDEYDRNQILQLHNTINCDSTRLQAI